MCDLPDPLEGLDGEAEAPVDAWQARRAQLGALFESTVYGSWPLTSTACAAPRDTSSDEVVLGGAASAWTVEVTVSEPGSVFDLLVVQPRRRRGPLGWLVGLNQIGNAEVMREASALGGAGSWPLVRAIERGYAVATLSAAQVVPSRPAEAMEVLRRLWLSSGGTGHNDPVERTGAVAAWGWAISRAIDVLRAQPWPAPEKVMVFGHSRYAKAALLAGAMDERVAVVVASQSGSGGAAPWRANASWASASERAAGTAGDATTACLVETLGSIVEHFPHWFCPRLATYRDDVGRLPVDQHELIALCAPRPVLLTNAEHDMWANPAGQWAMLRAASPVYELLGMQGCALPLGAPAVGTFRGDRLGWFTRSGGHSVTVEDWDAWLDYADIWLR